MPGSCYLTEKRFSFAYMGYCKRAYQIAFHHPSMGQGHPNTKVIRENLENLQAKSNNTTKEFDHQTNTIVKILQEAYMLKTLKENLHW